MQDRTHHISGQTYDEERALYNLQDTEVVDCTFAGPADGESAFKEARDITVRHCTFSLRYPFWHTQRFLVTDTAMDELTRASVWYSEDGCFDRCRIEGVKCLRECRRMAFADCHIVSPEFGWRCEQVNLTACNIDAVYFLFETRSAHIERLHLTGKYSFQYTRDLVVENSMLDTKDAFWHAENVTVRNTTLKGEYLGWYSKGLTLENCHIVGTQPFCYCEDLTLIHCTMEATDLAFEYSAVNADVKGHIDSVKTPKSGRITADSIGQVILEGAVVETTCDIVTRT